MASGLPIRLAYFGEAKRLEQPLNDALEALDARLRAIELQSTVYVLPPVEVDVPGVAPPDPTSAPWPVAVALPDGLSVRGLLLLKMENVSDWTNDGVPVEGAALSAWRQEGTTLWVQYISGTPPGRARFLLGAIRGNA